MSGEIIQIFKNTDLAIDKSIQIGSNTITALPGTLIYNRTTDQFQGYLSRTNAYNNSHWASLSLESATASNLGGIKVGNNLTITADGILSATSSSVSRKLQRVLIVNAQPSAGDYTSIGQCIDNFFGYDPTTGTYPDGELAFLNANSSVNYPYPGPTSRYIILVSPGIYEEYTNGTIYLPPYTTLQGDGEADCILRLSNASSIRCRESSVVDGLTINLSNVATGTTTGILVDNPGGAIASNKASNTVIKNVTFTLDNVDQITRLINIDSVTNIQLDNIKANITNIALPGSYSTQTLTGCLVSNADVTLNRSTLYLETNQTSKFCIDSTAGATLTLNNNSLIVNELNTSELSNHYNSCLRLTDTSATANYNIVKATGYDELLTGTNQRCYGVELKSTEPIYTTSFINSAGCRFIHYEDNSQYDEFIIPRSVENLTLNFNIGDYVKISGAVNGLNNGVVRIVNVFNETRTYSSSIEYSILQCGPATYFTDETQTTSLILTVLYNVNIASSEINATDETFIFTGTEGQENYNIIVANSLLRGNNPNITSNKITFTMPQKITVGTEGADYTSILSALNSIVDSSANKRYIINILPGSYYETGTLSVPEYVCLMGDSSLTTQIYFETRSGSYTSNNVGIRLYNNTTLRNLTVNITNSLDTGISSVIGIAGYNVGQSVPSADTMSGIQLDNITVNLDAGISTASRYAIKFLKTTYQTNNITITGTCSSSITNMYGIHQIFGTGTLTDTNIRIGGNITPANIYAIYGDRTYIKGTGTFININNAGVNNYGIFITNTLETTDAGTTLCEYNNIFNGGIIRTYDAENGIALRCGYHSTLIATNMTTQGSYFNYPAVNHSFLRTINNCTMTITGGETITNVRLEDDLGRPMITLDNLYYGDSVGSNAIIGDHNIILGVRAGTSLTSGARNIIMGVDTGCAVTSGKDNVLLGVNTGNSYIGSNTVIIGSNTCPDLISGNMNTVTGSQAGLDMAVANTTTIYGYGLCQSANNIVNITAIGASSGIIMSSARDNIILGTNTANSLTSGSYNIFVGDGTAKRLTSQNDVIMLGHGAGTLMTGGTRTVIIGNNAAANIMQSTDSTIIGYMAGAGLTGNTMINNTIIGSKAGSNISSGDDNTIIGAGAGQNLTTGSRNILMGSEDSATGAGTATGHSLSTGNDNLICGVNTGANLTVGNRNIILGNNNAGALDETSDSIIIGYGSGGNIAGSAGTDGENIIIGNRTGENITSGRTILIGHQAGKNATGDDLVIIGNLAGRTISGPRNTLIGNYVAGVSSNPNSNPVLGADNVMIGAYAGFQIQSGSYNTILGSGDSVLGGAGYNITSGSYNLIMGYRSGRNITSGSMNVLLGSNAGSTMRESNRNLIMGNEAGYRLGANDTSTPSNDNLILGNYAVTNCNTANKLLIIGQNAGFSCSSGENSTIIGNDAGYYNNTGIENLFIGNFAGQYNLESQNTMIGTSAGRYTSNTSDNTYIGYESGRGNSSLPGVNTGDKNVAIGHQAGKTLTTGYQNVLFGYKTGEANSTGSKNIMAGPRTGQNSNCSQCIFIGTAQTDTDGIGIGSQTSGDNDIFIGVDVGINNTVGTKNISIGYQAGKYNTTGNNNIFVGDSAGLDNTTGIENIMVGKNAGLTNATGDRNIIMGSGPGSHMGTNSNDSILLGTYAGQFNNADGSIFIGRNAGKLNTTGDGNIIIGPDAGPNTQLSSKSIMIGRNAGNASNITSSAGQNIFIGDDVASSTTTGIQNIAIGANSLADALIVNSTIAIGYEAGKNIGNRTLIAGGDATKNIIIGYQAVSNGDINSDNILIGTKVAQNVDNPISFGGNLLMGTQTGYNANLAVNSISIGNANRLGTGGITNIFLGTSAGDNVGIPNYYNVLTTSSIVTGGQSVNIAMPYQQVYTYFRDFDQISIRTGDADYQTLIASIQPVSGNTAISTIVFNEPYAGATTITSSASITIRAYLDNAIGSLTDSSRASGNSLLGNEAGNALTLGSKNIGFGTQAMYSNKTGKYNNIIGTQSGYNIISDNNTLIGTRAGYSLDITANTSALLTEDLNFNSNANMIYSYSLANLDTYEYGTVFDIENTTINDGRYTVDESGGTIANSSSNIESYIIVQGVPFYEEIGVPSTIAVGALKISASNFTVYTSLSNGSNMSAGWFTSGGNTYNGLIGSNTITQAFMDTVRNNSGVFQIENSKYNNGLHYVKYSADTVDGYIPTIDKLIPETFDDNVAITVRTITAKPNVTNSRTAISFTDFNYGNDMNMFFSTNKGVYNASPLTNKYHLALPNNSAVFFQSKSAIINDIERENIIFSNGYKDNIQFTGGRTTADYQKFDIIEINTDYTGGTIELLNGNIVVTTQGVYGLEENDYYELEGYLASNGSSYATGTVIKISDITTADSNTNIIINSSNPLPTGDRTLSKLIFKRSQLKNMNADVTNIFSAGDIVLFNIAHDYNFKSDRGAFVIKSPLAVTSTDRRLLIQGNEVIPDIYNYITFSQDKKCNAFTGPETAGIPVTSNSQVDPLINYRILQTNNYIDSGLLSSPNQIVSGWDIFAQKNTIIATGSNVYTLNTGNNTITATTDYEFVNIVAPCMILTGSPSNTYCLVKENKYPFRCLTLDSTYSNVSAGTITTLNSQSISSRFDTSNLSNVASSTTLFGIRNPADTFENEPLTLSTSIKAPKSFYASSNTNLFNAKSNDMVMSISAYEPGSYFYSSPGFTLGYFKHANVSHSNVNLTAPTGSTIRVTLNSPNTTVITSLGYLAQGDVVKLDAGATNYGYCELTSGVSNTSPTYTFDVLYNAGLGSPVTNTTANIVCNEFRTALMSNITTYFTYLNTATTPGEYFSYNFRNARTLVGSNSDFLRFSQVRTLERTVGEALFDVYSNIYVTDRTFNLNVPTMTPANNGNITSNNVVYVRETVPNEYAEISSNIAGRIQKYIVSIGVPTPEPGSNITAQIENINTPPTGFIDVYVNNTGTTGNTSTNYVFSSNTNALLGNISIDESSSLISISNIAPDISVGGYIPYRNDEYSSINLVTNTFDNIKPGMLLRLYGNANTSLQNHTFLVKNKVSSHVLEFDPTFYSTVDTTIPFTAADPFRIDIGFESNSDIITGGIVSDYYKITGQVISDRIDFNQFNNISTYNPSPNAYYVNYLALHKLPLFNMSAKNTTGFGSFIEFYNYNNYKILDGSFKLLSNAYTAVGSNSTLDFQYTGNTNNRINLPDYGDHVLIVPSSNTATHLQSCIKFINTSASYSVQFIVSGADKYIFNSGATFPVMEYGQIVKVTGSTAGERDGYYLTSNSLASTTSRIYIDQSYKDFTQTLVTQTVQIDSNVIYSSNIADVNLGVYLPGQHLKVEKTIYNNTADTVNTPFHNAKIITPNATTANTCLYIEYPTLTTESGSYSKISKCMLNTETSNIGFSTVTVNSGLTNLVISAQSNGFTNFRTNQQLIAYNNSGLLAQINTSATDLATALSMNFTIGTNTSLSSGVQSNIWLTKPITFKKIGVPVTTITTDGIVKFHYLDAQGNNLMLGSFTGQYSGATALSIHNVFIGNRVGQTNQGSGNILIGNETGFALSSADGVTNYDNKFAIYKNNFIGVPGNPLIGGDFATGRVGINTIDPDTMLTSILETSTRMVINGKVRAQAFNTFTGTHIVTMVPKSNIFLEEGMILVSTGNVNKLALIDTIVECMICETALDKRVYGIYAGNEYVKNMELFYCASVGEGCILVTNYNGDIDNGDYVCSSVIAGYGQKQADDLLHSYTVAKVTEMVDWSNIVQFIMYNGRQYKRALVSCTYHCG